MLLQYNGKNISWSHLTELDTRPGLGLWMVPKLKFKHISLTPFSKMCVDLAAQVQIHASIMPQVHHMVHTCFLLSESVSKVLKLTG